MSNSTGLSYTSEPLNHCLHWMEFVRANNTDPNKNPERHIKGAGMYTPRQHAHACTERVNNVDITDTFLSTVWRRKEVGGKSHRSNVLFMCLSFIGGLRYISRETFAHFKTSLAISGIIGQFLCWASSLISFFPHATELPNHSATLYCWQCVNMEMSATIDINVLCEWLRFHFLQETEQQNTKGCCSLQPFPVNDS